MGVTKKVQDILMSVLTKTYATKGPVGLRIVEVRAVRGPYHERIIP